MITLKQIEQKIARAQKRFDDATETRKIAKEELNGLNAMRKLIAQGQLDLDEDTPKVGGTQ